MTKISCLLAAVWCCAALTVGAQRSVGAPESSLTDWVTDGGDNQRTGWAKDEKILTKDNVKNLKLLWTMPTENQPRALHSLMPVLIIGQLNTSSGRKQVGIVNGISDNLYAFDVDTGKMLWHKHWT
jgi:glucose dehydrogenase